MKTIYYFFLFAIIWWQTGTAFADISIPCSLNPVGSGARAIGMGGAFIAIADDATAASWNPGGLIQLKEGPEISIVGAGFHRIENNEFGTHSEASGRQSVDKMNLNYLSVAYPFHILHRNMIISLNYQHLFDFTRAWRFPLIQRSGSLNRKIHFRQKGELYALGLAYCSQLTRDISFGFTLNIWDELPDKWMKIYDDHISGNQNTDREYIIETHREENFYFRGFNANIGLLWHINTYLTLGAVLKTPFKADVRYEYKSLSSTQYPAQPEADTYNPNAYILNEELAMPMSYGIGIAFRFSDQFTISGDIYRTEWRDFVIRDSEGKEFSPISDLPIEKSDIDPTHQLRIGAEYLFIGQKHVIPLRGGIFYDPAPAEGSPDDFYGFSIGSGIAIGPYLFDVAYQYRFGRNVREYMLQEFQFSQDVDEHTLYFSFIYHF